MNDIDCTVLMFTYERPYHLRRSLSYWANSECNVVIADGSKLAYESIPSGIKYLHRPGASITERILELIKNVQTKYAVFVPDDDFLGYEALDRSVRFLKENPSYSSVQGVYTNFWISKPFGIIVKRPGDYDYSRAYDWNDDCYAKRLEDINSYKLMHYCYSVVTVDTLKILSNLFSGLERIDGSSLFEALMAYSIAIKGKVKILDSFFSSREVVKAPDWLGIMSFENFISNDSPEYRLLIENLASESIKLYGVDRERAIASAEMAGKVYVNSMLKRVEIEIKKKGNEFKCILFVIMKKYFLLIIFKIKIFLQSTGVTSSKGINEKYFSSDHEAWLSYKRDWKAIRANLLKKQ